MSSECVFCLPNPNDILLKNKYAYIRFDGYPVTPGHLLIIPFRHVSSFFSITNHEEAAMWNLVREGKKYLDSEFQPEGYNIAINDGVIAGQTVMHLHIHLIPRYQGDSDDPKKWVHPVLKISEQMLQVKDNPPSPKSD